MMIKKRNVSHNIALIIFFCSLAELQSCSVFLSTPVVSTPYKLIITTGKTINPSNEDQQGNKQANPVIVDIYQLSKEAPFNKLDALALYQKGAQLLSDTLLKKRTLSALIPGEQRSITLLIKPETTVIGVFAEFSNYSESKGIAWVTLKKNEKIDYFDMNIDLLTVNLKKVLHQSFW